MSGAIGRKRAEYGSARMGASSPPAPHRAGATQEAEEAMSIERFAIVHEGTPAGRDLVARLADPSRQVGAQVLVSRVRAQRLPETRYDLKFGRRVTAYAEGGEVVWDEIVPSLGHPGAYHELEPRLEELDAAIERAQTELRRAQS